MYSNKLYRKLKQIIRDTLYTDIEFVRNRFINDDCPISIVVSAATRNKVPRPRPKCALAFKRLLLKPPARKAKIAEKNTA